MLENKHTHMSQGNVVGGLAVVAGIDGVVVETDGRIGAKDKARSSQGGIGVCYIFFDLFVVQRLFAFFFGTWYRRGERVRAKQ